MLAEHMTWMEYRDKVKRSVVILPMGSFEQHGPHLPLCVDATYERWWAIIPRNDKSGWHYLDSPGSRHLAGYLPPWREEIPFAQRSL